MGNKPPWFHGAFIAAKIKSGVPSRYLEASMADFKDTPHDDSDYGPIDLYIFGPNGCGKTHLAVAYLDYITRWDQFGDFVESVKFKSAPELMVEVRDTFNNSGRTEGEVVHDYSHVKFLILDDLGAENKSDFTMSTIYTIIQKRVNDLRPTIITSNLHPKEWRSIDPRIASRISGFQAIQFGKKSPDRRME